MRHAPAMTSDYNRRFATHRAWGRRLLQEPISAPLLKRVDSERRQHGNVEAVLEETARSARFTARQSAWIAAQRAISLLSPTPFRTRVCAVAGFLTQQRAEARGELSATIADAGLRAVANTRAVAATIADFAANTNEVLSAQRSWKSLRDAGDILVTAGVAALSTGCTEGIRYLYGGVRAFEAAASVYGTHRAAGIVAHTQRSAEIHAQLVFRHAITRERISDAVWDGGITRTELSLITGDPQMADVRATAYGLRLMHLGVVLNILTEHSLAVHADRPHGNGRTAPRAILSDLHSAITRMRIKAEHFGDLHIWDNWCDVYGVPYRALHAMCAPD